MSTRRRSKKPARRKPKPVRFTLIVESQTMLVTYKPHWMRDTGHFEFRSPYRPPRRIPVSTTGYLSHFASMDDVREARSPKAYARQVVLAALASRRARSDDDNQLSLFA
jgi:hypothetical protein